MKINIDISALVAVGTGTPSYWGFINRSFNAVPDVRQVGGKAC
jgi:hypothetical protein